MFERFTGDARRVVVYAQEECRLLCHQHIGTEHVLLGLLHDDASTGGALAEVGVSLAGARERIGQAQGLGKKEPHGHIPFTPRAKRVLELSLRHAQRLGQEHIAQPHLLRALLDVGDSVAVQTLVACGVDLDALAAHADELAAAAKPESRAAPSVGTPAAAWAPGPRWRPRRPPTPRGAGSHGDRVAELADLVVQRDALATALRRYGRHDEHCTRERGCTCGLQEVLDDLDPPESGGKPQFER